MRPQYFAERAQSSTVHPTIKYRLLEYQYHSHQLLGRVLARVVFGFILEDVDAHI